MKKIIIFISALVPFVALGQSTDQNYVKSKTYKEPTATSIATPSPTQATQSITYFDGLGRPIQQIANRQSGTGNDIVTHIEYDALGRQVKEYLPIVNGQTLDFHSIDNGTVDSYYGTADYPGMETTTNPYSEKLFESSPLNRVLKQAAPGNDWAMGGGKEVKFDYQTNTGEEVRLFKVFLQTDYTPSLIDDGNSHYVGNRLYKTITKDENWTSGDNNTTEEFKDKEGRVVLKRTYNNGDAHDTYYVYDDYGNLTYVIPPIVNLSQEVNGAIQDNLCYQYKYDYRNRLIEKKLPGKQRQYTAYNSQNMPVATGPVKSPWAGNNWGWLITKYDALGRVAYTGWTDKIEGNYNEVRTAIESQLTSNWFESYISEPVTIDGVSVNYTNGTYPNSFKLLTVNYYDGYSYVNAPTLPSDVEGETVLTSVKSMATGNWVRILDSPSNTNAELSYTLYDSKGRAIRTSKTNYLGGYVTVDSRLDFTGKPIYTSTYHRKDADINEILVRDEYEYTAQERLLRHAQRINGDDREIIAQNEYDDLGQLIAKQVGGEDSSARLQKVNYLYNIRGWLKNINDIDELQKIDDPKDLFAFKINYNTVENTVSNQVKALYNGNISETFWITSTDNTLRKYGYQYDELNRLTNSFYQKPERTVPVTNMYNEQMSYDKNGNIQMMKRNGDFDSSTYGPIEIDDLDYHYDADNKNQLMKVTDATNSPKGFRDDVSDINDVNDDYAYDANGNMIRDDNKYISSIAYNHLNLPVKINFANHRFIEYLYDAVGQKKKKRVADGTSVIITEYLDGYQYVDGSLVFFPHAEGYVNVTPCPECENQTQFNYVYQYKDHLGNIRVSYGYDEVEHEIKIIEESHYYPFGLKHTKYNSDKHEYKPDEEYPELMELVQLPAGEKLAYNYRYNSKEYQDELGLNWYDYGWRNYDPAIARWVNIDPLLNDLKFSFNDSDVDEDDEEEVYEAIITKLETADGIYNTNNLNPYGYGYNNPVSFDDPDGRCPWCVGAVVGALTDYGLQVAGNLIEGKNLGDALTDVDGGSILLSAATGATGAGLASKFSKVVSLSKKMDKANDVKNNIKKVEAIKKAEARAEKLSKTERSGKEFTKAGKETVKDVNKAKNGGKNVCETCGTKTKPSTQSKKGVTPSKKEVQVDHKVPKSKGGSGTPNNGQVLCRDCNIKKSNN